MKKPAHADLVQLIKDELVKWKASPIEAPLISEKSHMMRQKSYKSKAPPLSTRQLNRILEINGKTAWIEPYVTQEELVKATLKKGLVPPVVAEFKNITWGGAVMGSSLESSSHRFGQVNDVMKSYELLMGDGQILKATPTEHPELFWGVSGSFGSLATLLSLEVPLLQAKKFVNLEIIPFSGVEPALAFLRKLCKEPSAPDYIEGLIFDKKEFKVILGRMSDEDALPLISLASSGSIWYYQLIKERSAPFRMTLYDYLFRHDRGAFWMGSYALWPSLLLRFCYENSLFRPGYNRIKYPSALFRALAGPFMSSKDLYSWLHWKKEDWFKKNFVVQDFYLPEAKAAQFIEEALELTDIKPIWICPCKASLSPQFLSPHFQAGDLLFDVGIYGWPIKNSLESTRALESKTYALGGRKMFYSWNFMSPADIWRHYDQTAYENLRKKYFAEGVFPTFIDKISC